MTTVDERVERLADKLQDFARRSAAEGGVKAKLAQPFAEDAELIRKLKPSLIRARARGEAPAATPPPPDGGVVAPLPRRRQPKKQKAGGPNPWLVVGACFVAGVALAKWIDWRGHAHPKG